MFVGWRVGASVTTSPLVPGTVSAGGGLAPGSLARVGITFSRGSDDTGSSGWMDGRGETSVAERT
jgi:hypothetical protein